VARPKGSGKTTLTHQLRADGVDFGRYINADDIARTFEGGWGLWLDPAGDAQNLMAAVRPERFAIAPA
jgi:hypothetical protein